MLQTTEIRHRVPSSGVCPGTLQAGLDVFDDAVTPQPVSDPRHSPAKSLPNSAIGVGPNRCEFSRPLLCRHLSFGSRLLRKIIDLCGKSDPEVRLSGQVQVLNNLWKPLVRQRFYVIAFSIQLPVGVMEARAPSSFSGPVQVGKGASLFVDPRQMPVIKIDKIASKERIVPIIADPAELGKIRALPLKPENTNTDILWPLPDSNRCCRRESLVTERTGPRCAHWRWRIYHVAAHAYHSRVTTSAPNPVEAEHLFP